MLCPSAERGLSEAIEVTSISRAVGDEAHSITEGRFRVKVHIELWRFSCVKQLSTLKRELFCASLRSRAAKALRPSTDLLKNTNDHNRSTHKTTNRHPILTIIIIVIVRIMQSLKNSAGAVCIYKIILHPIRLSSDGS